MQSLYWSPYLVIVSNSKMTHGHDECHVWRDQKRFLHKLIIWLEGADLHRFALKTRSSLLEIEDPFVALLNRSSSWKHDSYHVVVRVSFARQQYSHKPGPEKHWPLCSTPSVPKKKYNYRSVPIKLSQIWLSLLANIINIYVSN